jgi:hypothetical protein
MAVMDYQTQDRLADYGFSIEFQSDSIHHLSVLPPGLRRQPAATLSSYRL